MKEKYLKVALVLIFGMWFNSLAQEGWQPSFPNIVYDIEWVNSNKLIAVGENIHISNDKGKSWTANSTGFQTSENYLLSVSFPNSSTGYAAGSKGLIIKSINGGQTWSSLPFPGISEENEVQKVQFADSDIGWILVRNYQNNTMFLLRTVNGGDSWNQVASGGGDYRFLTFHFADTNNGWIGGMSGTIQHTSDGGENWEVQSTGTVGSITNIDFVDSQNGVASVAYTPPANFLKTTDGGATWDLINTDFTGYFKNIQYFQLGVIYTSLDGKFYKSQDNGYHWNLVYENFENSIPSDFSFYNSNQGIAFDRNGNTFLTTSGGVNWEKAQGGYVELMYFKDATKGWAVGDGQFYSTKNGSTWRGDSLKGISHISCLYFMNDTKGYAGGKQGAATNFARTNDGGLTWQGENIGEAPWIDDIFFVNEEFGWAIGQFYINKSLDSGATWGPQDPGIDGLWKSIHFADENNGWAVGELYPWHEGVIINTTNGGLLWTTQYADTVNSTGFNDVEFYGTNVGYAISGYSKIFKTSDGGDNWLNISSSLPIDEWGNQYVPGSALTVINESSLFIAATAYGTNALLQSGDGGNSWQVIHTPGYSNPVDIFVQNSQNIWILCNSVIYITTNGGVTWVEDSGANNYNPKDYSLLQNYPNPFNPSTVIEFSIPVSGNVSLKVYNTLGEEVTELVNREMFAGYHSVNFNATNLSSGVYFYRINSGGFTQTNKMILIK